jgi:hypothetical protein
VKSRHDVVVVPDNRFSVDRTLAYARTGPFTVWYLGGDYARYLELCATAGQSCRVALAGEAINREASTLTRALINLDAYLASGRFPISWCSSDLAEGNPYVSSFCLDICRSVAMVKTAQSGERLLVIVDDPAFGRALAGFCRDNGIAAEWDGPHGGLRPWLRSVRAHAGFLCGWVRQRCALRRHPGDLKTLAAPPLWLMSWTEGHAGAAGADVKDRFLGVLPGWFRSAGYKIGWLRNPIAWLRPIDAIAESVDRDSAFEPAALAGRFFGVRELLRAYGHFLMLPFALRRRLVLENVDVTQMLRLALRRELASARLVGAALYAGLAAALQRAGLAPAALLYTFENQPWEKAMLAGFRRALPRTRLIGVQHAPFAERFFSGHISSRQWEEGTAPDILVSIGPEFRKRVIGFGAPSDRVLVGGALRFIDLLAPRAESSARAPTGSNLVLATCPMEARDAYELAHKAAVATAGMPGVRLAINFHPLVEASLRQMVCDRLPRLVDCSHIDFVEGSAVDWLQRADMLLYNSSSTVFEAAAMDIPVIYVGSSVALDLDTMSGSGVLRCRQSEELRLHIVGLLNDPELRRRSIEAARAHLQYCLAMPDPDFWIGLVRHAMNGKLQ